MANFTSNKRVKDAIRFKAQQSGNTYVILGGITPWADESAPPDTGSTKTIPDAFCALKAEIKIVKEDVAGIYSVRVPGDLPNTFVVKHFSELTTNAAVLAYTGDVHILIIGTLLDENVTGVSLYRKVGYATDLVPTAGHESDLHLTSGHVSNWGDIEVIEYRVPYPVAPGSQRDFYQILKY